ARVAGGASPLVAQGVPAPGAVGTITPTAPAGEVAVAPAAAVEAATGEVMSGTVAASPVAGAAPLALGAPELDDRALGTTHALVSVAASSFRSDFLVTAAGALLVSASTL